MGKRILVQRMGRGSPTFRSPTKGKKGPAKYPPYLEGIHRGVVKALVHDPGRYVPLALIQLDNGIEFKIPSAEGMHVGQVVEIGAGASIKNGNILPLGSIPEGAQIFNIELRPGDGGKLARQPGSYAILIGRAGDKSIVQLPSGKKKEIDNRCRATIGVPAGGGRIEKPLLKAGAAYHKWSKKARKWPRVRGVAMNAVSHPHGGGSHQSESFPTTVARETPPGRKVGHIAARRTGRKKR